MEEKVDFNLNETAKDMYKEYILELYRNPNNFGKLKKPTFEHKEYNPLCGDEIEISILIENECVKDINFRGKGCVLSLAAASLITDKIKGMNIKDVLILNKDDLLNILQIPITITRLKCILLPLEAIKICLRKNGKSSS